MAFTITDMRKFANEAWGQFGSNTVDIWLQYNNKRYFNNQLKPIPLVITQAQPYGKRLAFCAHSRFGRCITLNIPKAHDILLADKGALLHEMIHQYLHERGENPKHDGAAWRREIMRLTTLLNGRDIWAGRSKTMRKKQKVYRGNEAHPETGAASLDQQAIATWPHSIGIKLGRLGR